VGGGIGRDDRTNPRLFAVAIGLEEIETFVAVIVVAVQAVHGCFGRLCTWTFKGNQNQEAEERANREKKVALGKL
jgi:hypothetical protein